MLARTYLQGDVRFAGGVKSVELTDINSINQAQAMLMRAGGHAPPFAGDH